MSQQSFLFRSSRAAVHQLDCPTPEKKTNISLLGRELGSCTGDHVPDFIRTIVGIVIIKSSSSHWKKLRGTLVKKQIHVKSTCLLQVLFFPIKKTMKTTHLGRGHLSCILITWTLAAAAPWTTERLGFPRNERLEGRNGGPLGGRLGLFLRGKTKQIAGHIMTLET